MPRDGGEVRLDLRPISTLLPHEETIDSITRRMVAELRKDGVQKDPIIVDRATGVVLDGMHRLSALSILGIAQSVCDLVDYDSPRISLGRWLRVYRSQEGGAQSEPMAETGLTETHPRKEGLEALEQGEVPVAAFVDDLALLPRSGGSIDDGFEIVRKTDRLAQARGWQRSFAAEEQLDARVGAKNVVLLLTRRFDKRDVLRAGKERKPFPCKTSMHIVDPRPVGVNFPLRELKNGFDESVAARLGRLNFRMLPPNTLYEGRRYKERLLLLGTE